MLAISGSRAFVFSFILAAAYALGASAYDQRQRTERLHFWNLTAEIAVSEQLAPANIPKVKQLGFEAVIDLRPDGEARGQPSSRQVGAAVRSEGMQFFYVPVAHGEIPQAVVAKLAAALAERNSDVLLYCPNGRRAARAWALAEATRPGGLGFDAILAAVQGAGQSTNDLASELRERVAKRAQRKA